MEKVITFCEYACANRATPLVIQQPLRSKDLRSHINDQWYYNYITDGVDQSLLFDIVLAANFLNIESLLGLGSAKIASLITGRSIEEKRRFFKIQSDFEEGEGDSDEEKWIREENQFASEYF